MPTAQIVIQHTKAWIQQVVIASNFCPFAAKPFMFNTIEYIVADVNQQETELLVQFQNALVQLEENSKIETSFIIYPHHFADFNNYLNFLHIAQSLLEQLNFEGEYQLASFHPQYLFEGESNLSPTHYTNRSPYPTIHILRESSIETAIEKFPKEMETIYENNIAFTQEKGVAYMQALLAITTK